MVAPVPQNLEGWQRVRWARQRLFDSAEDAAGALGMKGGSYRPYERPPTSSKHTALTHKMAERFGQAFGVNPEWLFSGQGPALLASTSAHAAASTDMVADLLKTLANLPPGEGDEILGAILALLKARLDHASGDQATPRSDKSATGR